MKSQLIAKWAFLVIIVSVSCGRPNYPPAASAPEYEKGYDDMVYETAPPPPGGIEDNGGIQLTRASGTENPDAPEDLTENEFINTADWNEWAFTPSASENTFDRLTENDLVPAAEFQINELLNAYNDYPASQGEVVDLFSEVQDCPWNPAHKLIIIGFRNDAEDISDVTMTVSFSADKVTSFRQLGQENLTQEMSNLSDNLIPAGNNSITIFEVVPTTNSSASGKWADIVLDYSFRGGRALIPAQAMAQPLSPMSGFIIALTELGLSQKQSVHSPSASAKAAIERIDQLESQLSLSERNTQIITVCRSLVE